jgi:hypothetical protein
MYALYVGARQGGLAKDLGISVTDGKKLFDICHYKKIKKRVAKWRGYLSLRMKSR